MHPPASAKAERAVRTFLQAALMAVLASLVFLFAPNPALAQSAPTIADGGVTNTFPDGMRFSITVESDSPIEEIKLRYKILPDGTAAIGRPEFDPAASVATSLELGGADLYLPPGTVIEYHSEATDEEAVTTLGTRVATDTVLMLGNDDLGTLKHELTHVVTAQAGESPFGTMPWWLDEGTAVYGQGDPGGFADAAEAAIRRGNVFSVRQITSGQGDPDKVNLAYGQSWSIVKYLNETYGPEKFAQLFAEIKGGKRIDDALEAVYGFDQDGLDNEWRAANGLPPRETPEPTEDAQPNATDGPSDHQDEPQSDDGGGTSTVVLIALAVGLVVLAGAVAAAGWAVARRL